MPVYKGGVHQALNPDTSTPLKASSAAPLSPAQQRGYAGTGVYEALHVDDEAPAQTSAHPQQLADPKHGTNIRSSSSSRVHGGKDLGRKELGKEPRLIGAAQLLLLQGSPGIDSADRKKKKGPGSSISVRSGSYSSCSRAAKSCISKAPTIVSSSSTVSPAL